MFTLKLYLPVSNKLIKWVQHNVNMEAHHLLQCLPRILDRYPASRSKANSIPAPLHHIRNKCHPKSYLHSYYRSHLHPLI